MTTLPANYFDLILFDEGHHSVATTWETLKAKFPDARIVNYSATPLRADGQLMAGRIIYSYPVFRAIQGGFVKRLKAQVLNPKTLKYVRSEDGEEIEVSLDEVRRLGEDEADFRRAIVTSKETLNTIVSASMRELERIREASGDKRHKIIASALNYTHCIQIVEAYRARGCRANYVHSREGTGNESVFSKLDRHELDVIVQVRKLGEGFDHPHLSVAAVFSIFANLSPFVQFVGRIMRTIPGDPLNQGTVVFHAGANVAARWSDFQKYSEADQEFFQQLLPMEGLDFENANEIEVTPASRSPNTVEVREQSAVLMEEIPLIKDNAKAMEMLRTLRDLGYTPDAVKQGMEELDPIPTTKQSERKAKQGALDMRVKNEVGRILKDRKVNPRGKGLDKRRPERESFVVLKSAIDRQIQRDSREGRGRAPRVHPVRLGQSRGPLR